jgi:transcriptional regulator with XRE-family HTH domain
MVNTEELGRAIRRRRVELSLSLRDVADATGVSASTLSRIENGTGKPDADNIARLTSWLKMPMERILGSRRAEGETPRQSFITPESTPRSLKLTSVRIVILLPKQHPHFLSCFE